MLQPTGNQRQLSQAAAQGRQRAVRGRPGQRVVREVEVGEGGELLNCCGHLTEAAVRQGQRAQRAREREGGQQGPGLARGQVLKVQAQAGEAAGGGQHLWEAAGRPPGVSDAVQPQELQPWQRQVLWREAEVGRGQGQMAQRAQHAAVKVGQAGEWEDGLHEVQMGKGGEGVHC